MFIDRKMNKGGIIHTHTHTHTHTLYIFLSQKKNPWFKRIKGVVGMLSGSEEMAYCLSKYQVHKPIAGPVTQEHR